MRRALAVLSVPMVAAAAYAGPPVAEHVAPAVLNVVGHEDGGKGILRAQQRCVAFAKLGIIALTPTGPASAELAHPQNAHDFAAHLEAAGAHALGLFYLAMRRSLDHLAQL